jgi:hypothetical protein
VVEKRTFSTNTTTTIIIIIIINVNTNGGVGFQVLTSESVKMAYGLYHGVSQKLSKSKHV